MLEFTLTLAGLLPFAAGYGMHWMMTAYPDVRLPYGLIGLAFLLLWGGIAFLAGIFARRTPLLSIACMNGVALLVLVLLVIQELVLGAYFSNAAGIWTQLYFLPLLQLGFSLTSWSSRVFAADAAACLLMVAVSYLGFWLGRRQSVT